MYCKQQLYRFGMLSWLALFLVALASCGSEGQGERLFAPVEDSGLPDKGNTFGACVLRINDDSLPDLMLSTHGDDISLYLGSRDCSFTPYTPATLPGGLLDVHGSASCDYNNDGLWDAYITVGAHRGNAWSRNQLWSHRSSPVFVNEGQVQSILEDRVGRGRGAIWADLDRDSVPELLILNYESSVRLLAMREGTWRDETRRLPVVTDFPYWAECDWIPTPEERRASIWSHAACAGDLNGDGWTDLVISSRLGTSGAWLNDGDGALQDLTAQMGLASAVFPHLPSHCAVGDLDNDGDLDLVLTYRPDSNVRPRRHPLEIRLNQGVAADRFSEALQVQSVPDATNASGCVLADFDNDGFLDAYLIVRGENSPVRSNILLRGLGDGRFDDVTDDWGGSPEQSRASESAVAADFDLDGDVDLLTCNGGSDNLELNQGMRTYANRSEECRGITIQLEDPDGTPHGLGARVYCQGQMREVASVATPFSASILPVHFGLAGSVGPYSIEIHWNENDGSQTIQKASIPSSGAAYLVAKGAEPRLLPKEIAP